MNEQEAKTTPDTVCWGDGERIPWEEFKRMKEEKEDAESD